MSGPVPLRVILDEIAAPEPPAAPPSSPRPDSGQFSSFQARLRQDALLSMRVVMPQPLLIVTGI